MDRGREYIHNHNAYLIYITHTQGGREGVATQSLIEGHALEEGAASRTIIERGCAGTWTIFTASSSPVRSLSTCAAPAAVHGVVEAI